MSYRPSFVWQEADQLASNHGTFYANQVSSLNVLVNNPSAAINALNTYFKNQFLDQIAASGEQPFEAVRTRPFHYRCFNLEGMIVS